MMEHLYREGGFWCGTDDLFLCLVRLGRISVSQALFLLPKIYRHRRENGGIGMIIYNYMESIGKDAQGRRSGKPYGGKQPAVI